jgi:phage tail sheath protein FI
MIESFLHGIDIVEVDNGRRPITTTRSSVIGIVGTAPKADDQTFPLDTPVLINSPRETASLGEAGTLPSALAGIFAQIGALVVVVRVAEGNDTDETKTAIIGGVDAENDQYTGIQALLAAQSSVHVTPRILIAPGFSHDQTVCTHLLGVADQLRAVVIADGTNTTDTDVIAFRQQFGSARLYIVDPWVKVWDANSNEETVQPSSAYITGLIAKSDQERGFWTSPSNQIINSIVGSARPIDFTLGNPNSRANILNENSIATVIQQNGYRLWGNRSCAADPKWAFLSVRRTADMIHESLLNMHLWAVDRNLSKTTIDDVLEGVNAYLRHLRTLGAIINGKAWADNDINTPDQLAQGKVTIDFDFTPPYPAEHIRFRSCLTNEYLTEILSTAG